MTPRLAQLALVEHEDVVHILNRGQPMCDRQRRAAGHQHAQRIADEQLRFRVHARRRFIQDQYGRIERQSSRERQQLFLPHRQRCATFRDPRVVASGKRFDEPVRVHRTRRVAHTRVVDRVVTEADVARDRA